MLTNCCFLRKNSKGRVRLYCVRTGTSPQGMDHALGARVVSPQRGSRSRGLGCQEGGTDTFMTLA